MSEYTYYGTERARAERLAHTPGQPRATRRRKREAVADKLRRFADRIEN